MPGVAERTQEYTIEQALRGIENDLREKGILIHPRAFERLQDMAKDAFLKMAETRDLDPMSERRDESLMRASINLGRLIETWIRLDAKSQATDRPELRASTFQTAYNIVCPCYPCA